MPLDKMSPGQKGKVIEFTNCDNFIVRRLVEIGIVPGKQIKYIRRTLLRDPIIIQIEDNAPLTLRNAEAALINVEVQ